MKKSELDIIENKVLQIMSEKVSDIVASARKNIVVVEEKDDGDSATTADIEIGKLLSEFLRGLIAGSVVVEEESFCKKSYDEFLSSKYAWIIDPIDGTKAFRDPSNAEWCVGVCLLEDKSPIFSCIFIPEKYNSQRLLSANIFDKTIKNFGKKLLIRPKDSVRYVSHNHLDTERNEFEKGIAEKFPSNEIIRAYAGHSTLVQIAEVALEPDSKVFTRRSANIWDIVQSAFLVEAAGGCVCYESGEKIFPIDPKLLRFEGSHLKMPSIVAASKKNIDMIFN